VAHHPSYVVITPARDEERYLPDLARSLRAQTVPFDRWVIVDDGSRDGTCDIARRLADEDERITLLERDGRGARESGCGDLRAFNAGLAEIEHIAGYDFVGKADADLAFPDDYYERLFAKFAEDPSLGIAGGHCYERRDGGRLVLDRVPDDHVRGATKTYRAECFRQLRPLAEVPGWDTVDEVRARVLGWRTRSFEELGVIHQKPVTGGSGGVLRGRFVLGRISHFLGYDPAYFALRVARNTLRRPYVVGGVAMAAGYASAAIRHRERIEDESFRAGLRDWQRRRMSAAGRRTGSVS
jgi:poly-beta-1,6-N-acetyl-D-glucosamine synthase